MKIIVCDCCGGHKAPYGELNYVGSAQPLPHSELCQECVGILTDIAKVRKASLDEYVVAIEIFRRLDQKLAEMLKRINAVEVILDTQIGSKAG